jgi:hypothetical protein
MIRSTSGARNHQNLSVRQAVCEAKPKEARMPKAAKSVTWVVYLMTLHGKHSGVNAVCEQSEWDALELSRPGYHTLLQAGIASEGEAERIARQPSVGANHGDKEGQ